MTELKPSDRAPRVVSLGCRLNTYESEVMRAHARDAGLANAIIVNTCSFIGEAKKESVEAVLEMGLLKAETGAKLIVSGCMAWALPARVSSAIRAAWAWQRASRERTV